MSVIRVPEADAAGWECASCGEKLVTKVVELVYLDAKFDVELPTCSKCGQVLITENLALGKMQQVERMLEDK
ncbi:DVU_1557 family redox protein [Pseudodesulfovibrio sediminis]|uniref:DUF7479 domain-containing protein n=1 Tax=Pseudodesulfovibrio sediminis TaxID=2810563 RepID=A0ABN6ET42_9BACT|nr:CLJU_RS11820 family redox protein [Pseudodesulfovibrio sediminis]BCS88048.1 hypothetical protein PSDVSF_12900 [Pseudodesulfovibrio sediminis]